MKLHNHLLLPKLQTLQKFELIGLKELDLVHQFLAPLTKKGATVRHNSFD
jgi:hypothetical protein